MAQTFERLKYTQTVGGETSISWTSISQSYTDLYMTYSFILSGATNWEVNINGGNNVWQVGMTATQPSSPTYSAVQFSHLRPMINTHASSVWASPCTGFIHFEKYNNLNASQQVTGVGLGGSANIGLVYSAWNSQASSSSISNIYIAPATNYFEAGGSFALYGILKA